jgi:hypothetical protein
VLFRTATEWVARLADAKHDGRLEDELAALRRIPLLIVDLCRYRDYADIVAAVGLNALGWLGFSLVTPAGLSA